MSAKALLLLSAALALPALALAATAKPRDSAAVLMASAASDWRRLDEANTVYLELPAGRVVIELLPAFAPAHVARIKALAAAGAFDGKSIVRVQDNYVVQWGNGEQAPEWAKEKLPVELAIKPIPKLPFTKLADGDLYAPEVGHVQGFPAARNRKQQRAWLTHCYAMVGVGRGAEADSGNGAELYVVSGHAPRHLDRNVTVVGRVVQGMPLLTSLPRGSGALGFYTETEAKPPIVGMRLAASLPEAERTPLEVLRTDTPLWQAFVAARRSRHEDWFIDKVGHIELCNVPIPVRAPKPP